MKSIEKLKTENNSSEKCKTHTYDLVMKLNICECSNPKPRNCITEAFEPYTLCDNCGKEIL